MARNDDVLANFPIRINVFMLDKGRIGAHDDRNVGIYRKYFE